MSYINLGPIIIIIDHSVCFYVVPLFEYMLRNFQADITKKAEDSNKKLLNVTEKHFRVCRHSHS